jgi:hypothetical protein
MEHGPHSAQRDADPAPGALADLRPECPQQPFDLAPSKIGRRRLCEDPSQGPSVPAVHLDMISEMDIGDRRINHRAAAVFDFARPSGIEEGSGDAASAEVVEEGLGFVEVGGVEAFGEPAEDRGTLEDRKRLRPIGRNNGAVRRAHHPGLPLSVLATIVMNCYNGIEAPTQEEQARRGFDAVLAVSAAGSLSRLRALPDGDP